MDNYYQGNTNQQYNPNAQQYRQQNGYQTPQYHPVPPTPPTPPTPQVVYPQQDPTTKVMGVGEYVGFFILSSIPVINIIMWIVWLCSSNTNRNKKNLIIAYFVLVLITVILTIIAYFVLAAVGVGVGSLLYNLY